LPTKSNLLKEIEGVKELLSTVLDSLPIIVYTCEAWGDFNTLYISDNLKRITGYSPEYFISYTPLWMENIHPDDIVRVLKNQSKVFEQEDLKHEYRWRIADGSYIQVRDWLRLVRSVDGAPDHIVGIWEIVADRGAVERASLDAERIFAGIETAASMGRNLNEPLQLIVNRIHRMRETLRKIPDSDEKEALRDSCSKLEVEVRKVNRMIFNLQDQVKIKPMKPELIETPLRELVDEALSLISIPEKVKVALAIDDGLMVNIDPSMMKHALISLMTNAVQAMPSGGQLTLEADKTDRDWIIAIHDTGIGIPEDTLNNLLRASPFGENTGQLGLPISERMVRAHNGRILVESKVGVGTTFTIRVPIA
jgi:two-component system, NtrC family, sensor kinase